MCHTCQNLHNDIVTRAGIGAVEGTHLLKGPVFLFGRLGRFPHLDEIHSLLKGCCWEVQTLEKFCVSYGFVLWFAFRVDSALKPPCQAYMCLVHGKVENRIHNVEAFFTELGGPEGDIQRHNGNGGGPMGSLFQQRLPLWAALPCEAHKQWSSCWVAWCGSHGSWVMGPWGEMFWKSFPANAEVWQSEWSVFLQAQGRLVETSFLAQGQNLLEAPRLLQEERRPIWVHFGIREHHEWHHSPDQNHHAKLGSPIGERWSIPSTRAGDCRLSVVPTQLSLWGPTRLVRHEWAL